MYILIRIEVMGVTYNEVISKRKKTLVEYLKTKGYYWSRVNGRYINDRTIGHEGKCDYEIEEIKELK